LLEETLKIGFFYYGPRLWMIGEIDPLKSLQSPSKRKKIIEYIIASYPTYIFSKNEIFFRLRIKPDDPSNYQEYDTPPVNKQENGRLNTSKLQIMYGSQNLDICIHECRATIEDELFVAILRPTRDLKLLDISALIDDKSNEFESVDLAMHILFSAEAHSYKISQIIAKKIFESGFDGIIYPSYFSKLHTGAVPCQTIYGISIRKFPACKEYAKAQIIPNLALFGRPIEQGLVIVESINRVSLNKVDYQFSLGPVL